MKPELITAIIAVAAVISPVLTTFINNYYAELENKRTADKEQQLVKQRTLEKQHQKFVDQNLRIRDIYEKYTEYTFEVISTRGKSSTMEQGKYYGLVILYVDADLRDKISDIQRLLLLDGKNDEFDRDPYSSAIFDFRYVAPQLSSLINKLPKEKEL